MSKVCSKAADRVARANGFLIIEPVYRHPLQVNKIGETMRDTWLGATPLKGRMTKRRIKAIIRNW